MATARLSTLIVASLIVCYITGNDGHESGGCRQMREGCKIDDNSCVCGYGCYTEYRYTSHAECQKALRVSRQDICQSIPCRHKGVCSQIMQDPGYKCRCEGSGYYGARCHKACPKFTAHMTSEYPFECIVI